ncbi:ESX secretion-associated protein EspG [Nocardia aurea]|uniref:ESX secretion-associated protein EspG n=1 Tax=Nocardia aurea TaxID=2144174 RepID=UPI0033B86F4D
MNWTLTPDQFALAWERTDGDRIPYPLSVRLSARDTVERAAQLPALTAWCDRVLDADLEAALRVLARPTVRLEVYGECDPAAARRSHEDQEPDHSVLTDAALGAESGRAATPLATEPDDEAVGSRSVRVPVAARSSGNGPAPIAPYVVRAPAYGPSGDGPGPHRAAASNSEAAGRTGDPETVAGPRPVRVLGATAGHIAVVAAQRPGSAPDRGGDIRLFIGGPKSLAARVISTLPENPPGTSARLVAPLPRVREDSRDLVTVPVAGPTAPARIRRLLGRPRDGIGQIVVSATRADGELHPFGVLCWVDITGDGRYAIRTGADVDVIPVDADGFAAQLRPMLNAAGRSSANSR